MLFGQSVINRIADEIVSRVAANYEPQATAVELAQLGEGCRGQAAPCKEWIISSNRDLRETK